MKNVVGYLLCWIILGIFGDLYIIQCLGCKIQIYILCKKVFVLVNNFLSFQWI